MKWRIEALSEAEVESNGVNTRRKERSCWTNGEVGAMVMAGDQIHRYSEGCEEKSKRSRS